MGYDFGVPVGVRSQRILYETVGYHSYSMAMSFKLFFYAKGLCLEFH